jgi:hypothetical protein
MADAIVALSAMWAQWQQKRWLTYVLAETVLTATGATTYTIGPGGAFNVARPDRLEAAFVRLPATSPAVDYPIQIIDSREDYNGIALKTFQAWPYAVFYESTYPLGILHFWPVPMSGAYELHVFSKGALPTYAAETDPLNVPAEYLEAMIYSLVVRLEINYGQDPKPAHVMAMKAAMNTIRQSNVQLQTARMPGGLPGMGRNGQGSNMAAFIGGYR